MQNGFVPATINFSEKRAGCNLSYVPNQPIKLNYKSFMSCNYAFGGNNAAVVIGKDLQLDKDLPVEPKRTVFTGADLVTSLGPGIDVNLRSMRHGKRAWFQISIPARLIAAWT
jgi:hypothetical protein